MINVKRFERLYKNIKLEKYNRIKQIDYLEEYYYIKSIICDVIEAL